ncbi:MAG: exostosin family protein [Candidatus Peregrinibacteria bacterium]|nr:exostosin family protein [Candidatus Peregrinibacteria bacterium]MCB9808060.1 exostosin family protein [Candidatus Peribacteria bacterium]
MKTVYAELLDDVPYVPFLYPNLGAQKRESILFLNNAFTHITEPFVTLVDTPEKADAILLPHNYSSLKNHHTYVQKQIDLAKRLGKHLVVFWHGDSDRPFPSDDAIVFRTSAYRGSQRPNEIMMPAYAEDLLDGELTVRLKHGGKPIVGFCGWADYKNFKNRIGTLVQNMLTRDKARVKGITYRMRAIAHLQQSDRIQQNFIIRRSYSGNSSTIKTDPKKARQEYIENLLGSDYALVIKGDGNYSYRFYEALSLGRIPVLLDTDCILPLEDEIAYSECVLRVPYADLSRLSDIVANHYSSISRDDFIAMQKKAREVFETYLRVDSFLTRSLTYI